MIGSCRFNAVGDKSRPFVVHAVNEPAEPILTDESAPTGAREPRRTSWRRARPRGTVTMGEPANRLDDTLRNTAGNRERLALTLINGEVSQWPTEVYVEGGAGMLHLHAGVRQ